METHLFQACASHGLAQRFPVFGIKHEKTTPTSANQLVQQAEILETMAESTSVDSEIIERAQAAIERDIAFLSLSDEEWQALYEELVQAAGDTYDFPDFDDLELEITPEAAEAARFLVELLLAQE